MIESLPSGRVFLKKVISLSYIFSIPALAILLPCLYALLDLTTAQWNWFLTVTAVYAAVITPLQSLVHRRIFGRVPAYLDAREAGEVSDTLREAAFADVIDLPRRSCILGLLGWLVPVCLVAVLMELRWTHWTRFETASVVLSGLASGLVAAIFLMFIPKRMAEPVRMTLASEIGDPVRRASLVRSTSVRTKLFVAVTAMAVVPVVFAVLLFQSMASRSIESFTTRWQSEVVASVIEGMDRGGLEEAFREVMAKAPALAETLRVSVVDVSESSGAGFLPVEEHVLVELRGAVARGKQSGDSARLPSDVVFAWHTLPDGRLLMAWIPARAVEVESTPIWLVFAALLLVSGLVALSLSYLLADDVSRATGALKREAERLASGDLRGGSIFESEDELGSLGRAFETMSGALRATVARVAAAADRVDATAAEMLEVSESVTSVTVDQVQGIQQTTSSMEAINHQVQGIADSAQALNVSVEESSSSILELGAAGDELKDTAGVLGGKVNEVSSSIEQMVRSVKQVLENTESLSEAAVETSASMAEMATSMREVDATAEETAELSEQVVSSAETGQNKMVETIQGMDAIREATETAERVIRGLGGRTSEIGAILDVIDDVADENNLLALNAAIIAAQAGEHGRAFSVVADEIKDLADRVLASTKEIGGLIRSVQDESANAIGAIERGALSVARGVDLAAEAGVSLEDITRASRDSGQRISGIVHAVREQARAASHVVELMERVRGGVEEIRTAAVEQDRGNEIIHNGAVAMRDVAQQVRGTTEEQARGSGRIRESIESVREAVERINSALQEQSAACRSAVELLEALHARTQSNDESSKRLDKVSKDLVHQAEELRDDVRRFRI
jgi:methyl-accepting chemotaxis protein